MWRDAILREMTGNWVEDTSKMCEENASGKLLFGFYQEFLIHKNYSNNLLQLLSTFILIIFLNYFNCYNFS